MRRVGTTGLLVVLLAISLVAVMSPETREVQGKSRPILNETAISDGYVTTFPIQQNRTGFTPYVLYPVNNTVWVITVRQGDQAAKRPLFSQIVNFTIAKGGKSFTTPVITLRAAIPSDIVYDGYSRRVWFLENDSLAYYDPTNFPINYTVAKTFPGGYPEYMAIDHQDNIWITLLGTNQIVQYSRAANVTYDLPTSCALTSFGCGLQGITVDYRDGSIWFAEGYAGKIGHLTPCNPEPCARINDTGPPSWMNILGVSQVTVDSKGLVWFTVHDGNEFGSYDSDTQEWKLFPIGYCSASFPDCSIGLPNAISTVKDQVWFSEHIAGRIARYNETDGTLTEYVLPSSSPFCLSGCQPYAWWMRPGSNNLVWFTALGLGEIGYVDSSLPVPFKLTSLSSIVVSQAGCTSIVVSSSYTTGPPPSFNGSVTSEDALSNPPMLTFSRPVLSQSSNGVALSTLNVFAGRNATTGPRYVALTAYNENVAVNAFVRVDVVGFTTRLWTCITSLGLDTTIGFAIGISGVSIGLVTNVYRQRRKNLQ